jgi:phospholipid N-methyltransferase
MAGEYEDTGGFAFLQKVCRLTLFRFIWRVLVLVLWLLCFPWVLLARYINRFVVQLNGRGISGKYWRGWAFLKSLIMNPQATGAVFPSSRYLAKVMAAGVCLPNDGLVIELGAGTGAITEALLASGVAAERFVVIERSPSLAAQLRVRFPGVEVLTASALDLVDLLAGRDLPVSSVVSSLPLRSLSPEVQRAILMQISRVLPSDGRYVHFTYDISSDGSFYPAHYCLVDSKIVWRNVPPAKVERFIVQSPQ